MTLRWGGGGGGGGGGSRLSVIMTLTVGNMICESPLSIYSICIKVILVLGRPARHFILSIKGYFTLPKQISLLRPSLTPTSAGPATKVSGNARLRRKN